MINELKEFLMRGNILDLAVGVIIGSAFGKIVASVVNDIIMPLIGAIMTGIDFKNLSISIGSANILYGNFIQTVIEFTIIGVFLFFVIKAMKKAIPIKKVEEKIEVKEDIQLLKEIRDLLKK
ncbi:MAG: large conductance mechanosensitive channel protein MscL [bacterium]